MVLSDIAQFFRKALIRAIKASRRISQKIAEARTPSARRCRLERSPLVPVTGTGPMPIRDRGQLNGSGISGTARQMIAVDRRRAPWPDHLTWRVLSVRASGTTTRRVARVRRTAGAKRQRAQSPRWLTAPGCRRSVPGRSTSLRTARSPRPKRQRVRGRRDPEGSAPPEYRFR